MTNINQTTTKSKISLVLIIISLVILSVMTIYLVYSKDLTRNNQTNSESSAIKNDPVNNTDDDLVAESDTSDVSNQTTKDSNRYYNDEDGYSFILPEGYEIRQESEIPGYKEMPKYPYRFGLDTSFDYQKPNSDDPNSNPDIWIFARNVNDSTRLNYNRPRPEDFANCKDGSVNSLKVRECRYQDYMLGGSSVVIEVFSNTDKVFQLESHDDYNDSIQQIIKSFKWH